MTLGVYLRDARRRAGLSLRKVAAEAGIAFAYLSQIERDNREPSPEVLERLCLALQLDAAYTAYRAGRFPALPDWAATLSPDVFAEGWRAFRQVVEALRPVEQYGIGPGPDHLLYRLTTTQLRGQAAFAELEAQRCEAMLSRAEMAGAVWETSLHRSNATAWRNRADVWRHQAACREEEDQRARREPQGVVG